MLNLTPLSFGGLAGRFRYFLAFGSLVYIKLIGIGLFLVCKAWLTPDSVNLTLNVLEHSTKPGPNRYFIAGYGMKVFFLPGWPFKFDALKVLNLTPLSFWCFSGLFSYFLVSGRLLVIRLDDFSFILACLAGLTHWGVNLTLHVPWYLPKWTQIKQLLLD